MKHSLLSETIPERTKEILTMDFDAKKLHFYIRVNDTTAFAYSFNSGKETLNFLLTLEKSACEMMKDYFEARDV